MLFSLETVVGRKKDLSFLPRPFVTVQVVVVVIVLALVLVVVVIVVHCCKSDASDEDGSCGSDTSESAVFFTFHVHCSLPFSYMP